MEFEAAGWTALQQQSVDGGRGANPTRLGLARGKQYLQLLVYAWKITGEGNGRTGTKEHVHCLAAAVLTIAICNVSITMHITIN